MEMMWKRPSGVKVTSLCIFIDKNIDKICGEERDEELENKIYNYIWLIIRSLVQKKNYFKNYHDYDEYSFFASNRIYFALIKSRKNAGRIIRGREIQPIRSVLNYIKALLYPMKVEYQNQNFDQVSSGDFNDEAHSAFGYGEVLTEDARASQGVANRYREYLASSIGIRNIDQIITKILKQCHYSENSIEYKNLKYSILISAIRALRDKNKLVKDPDNKDVYVWNQDKNVADLIGIYLQTFYDKLKEEFIDCYAHADITDEEAQMILDNQFVEVYGKGDGGNEN